MISEQNGQWYIVTWQDPTVPIPMVVEGILPYYARDGSSPHHLEVALKAAKGMQ